MRSTGAAARLLIAAALALALPGCGGGRPSPTTGGHAGTTYVMRDLDRGWSADPGDTTKDVWVSLHWPEFTAAPGAAARDSLSAWVRGQLFAGGDGEPGAQTLDSLAARFIGEYREFREQHPRSALAGWYQENVITVTWDSLGVVALSSSTDGYTGGAHGYASRVHALFDATTGRRLRAADLVRPERADTLAALAEAAFRAGRQLAPGDDLKAAGFWFEGGRFRLNDNFGVDRDGWIFYFNSYEIAPYAWGPTEVRLAWRAVRPLLRGDGPLGALAAR